MSIEIVHLNTTNAELLKDIAPEVFDHEINPQYLEAFLGDSRHIMYLGFAEKVFS